ncbi:CDP-alcohol phosphatidyltransferase family protein [Ornithinimicrobium avium]|uniref:CDP-alcohol phosphatidyltransferase family protein n=1 Tax=Ornithinimicrobium avium TaxID=2283195 RepID=A0A345NSA0_9MICO|nr:CDP-alcohol phosphatidyltransferase family protein [Ornithinimicrobium avium]AXH97908.1 CDP-alcohol phosphatidyltransferase family protein [Ornithinimicrobium avium]
MPTARPRHLRTAVTLQVVLLAAVGVVLRWGPIGWVAALVSLVVVDVATARLARSYRVVALGPADVVTLVRLALSCGIVAVVVGSSAATSARPFAVAVLGAVALALDWVDGRVARRTRTASPFGGRFDGEADAFLLLVLSVPVAAGFGWWVLVVGLARYGFGVAGVVLPWLRAQLHFRYWRKVVTATAGIALVVAAADVVPRPLASAALVVAVALIGESFGRDIWWLRSHAPVRHPQPAAGGPA